MIFGPLLDAPPAYPDTVLTTLIYLETTLEDLWNAIRRTPLNGPTAISDLVYCAMERPLPLEIFDAASGMMHTLVSFLGWMGGSGR